MSTELYIEPVWKGYNTVTGQFLKGHVPHNKGKKWSEWMDGRKAKKPGIGKRSYYGFPNGVEAEDICRYLSFNLGNVVKYACRAGRKDAKKKIEDLQKARDYLDNVIKRLEEGDE